MSTVCTRCQGTGFLNTDQMPDDHNLITNEDYLMWIKAEKNHDVQVCDCCGDGDEWYGVAGEHYNGEEKEGAYDYNGGLCECH